MGLENLIGLSLERIEPDAPVITRLVRAARRNIIDAQELAISAENRFDAAYKAIAQLANASLQAHGFRTLTSRPGHHMTMIQSLSLTIGLDRQTIILLDGLRKQRNVADYSGDIIPLNYVDTCIGQAQGLLLKVEEFMAQRSLNN